MKSYVKGLVPLGLGLSLALGAAAALLSFRSLAEQTEAADWVTHTHVAIEGLETLRAEVLKAENARRGYVLTADASFLERYSAARGEILKTLGELRTLTADNPAQQKRLDDIRPLIEKRIQLLEQSIAGFQSGGRSAGGEAALTFTGADLTTQISDAIRAMESAEKELLRQRDSALKQGSRRTRTLLLGGTLLTFALILGVFTLLRREIAERARAEEDLNRFFNVSADMMCAAGTDGYFKRVNPAWEKSLGYSVAELLARPYVEFVHPDDRAATQAAAQESYATGLPSFENRYRTKQGDYRWLNWNSSPDQQRGLIYAAARDITERKKAEEDLRNLAASLEDRVAERTSSLEAQAKILRDQASLLDLAHDSIFVRDMNSAVRFWNRGAEETYGWTKEEAHGKVTHTLLQTVFPEPLAKIEEALFDRGRWEGELIHTCRDASRIVVASRWALLREADGAPSKVLEINRDITERKRAEDEIHRLNLELEQRVKERTAELLASNAELEAFASSVSHDLRAPLRHVDGFSRILVEEHAAQLDPEGRRLLERVRHATQHMGELVDDLLSLSRVSRREISPLVTDLNTLAAEVIADVQTACQGRRVEFRTGRLPFAECDPGLIRQVFANLLANAVKFTRPRDPAVIELGQTERDGNRVIFVRDNGVGFSMKYADKLFGIFQRLHRSEDFEGTGVGLVTVQRIVHKHNGRIWAEAEVDKGATFFFTLESLEGPGEASPAPVTGGLHARE
ncbi:MAG TPA: PAS domain S-box protein [Candidatus Acidoferrales bacterium]|nr:PAS domain S-box protein [Candidatus Acidoferrales bacterium]